MTWTTLIFLYYKTISNHKIYIIYFDWWSWDSFYESFTFTNRLMGYVIFYKRFLELAAFKKITYGKSLCPTWSFIYKSFYFY